MGKVPILMDKHDLVVTEAAAIGLYLADRYSLGKLAPSPDDAARAAYLPLVQFSTPSVIKADRFGQEHGRAVQAESGRLGYVRERDRFDGERDRGK